MVRRAGGRVFRRHRTRRRPWTPSRRSSSPTSSPASPFATQSDDPHLECPRGVDPGAITRVLDHYSCPVRVFDCWEITDAASRHSDAWLRIMARKRLEFLTLFFGSGGTSIHTLHPSIFSCRDLAIIFLKHCDIPATPPGFAGLPRLTGLHLCDVAFVGEGARDLELLIATAPLLGHLHLVYLRLTESNGNPWVIQAPKLQEIRIVGGDRWWQVNDLPSIEVATIEDYDDHGFINLVTAVAAASQLTLDIPIADDNILEGFSHPFDNLNYLSLDITLCLQSSVLSVFCLLRNAPKVKSLCIEVYGVDPSVDDEVDGEFLNAQWTEDLFLNLTSVEMMNLMCTRSEMHFIELVLSKARRLEKLNVCVAEECPRPNEDVAIELVKFRRASPQAEVFFKRTHD